MRQALGSADPARAALAALAAFHGLRDHHLRAMLLTDIDAARLRIGDRTILLAGPVRERLTAWLNHWATRWSATLNPHLFFLAVVDGPQVDDLLHVAPAALDLE